MIHLIKQIKLDNSGFILLMLFINYFALSQDHKYITPYDGYQKGDTLYTFNEKNPVFLTVKSTSDPMFILPANSIVRIAKTTETDYQHPFNPEKYIQVSVRGKIGFMQAKDLSVEKVPIKGTQRSILLQFMLDSNQNHALRYREFYTRQIVFETELELRTTSFSAYFIHPAGLDSLTGIFVIDHHAEACGYDGGETYYYYDPENLEKMAHLISVGDGGIFHRVENLIFPSDEGGQERKVIFEAEEMNVIDEETEWEEITKERRVYQWLGGRLYPEFERFQAE